MKWMGMYLVGFTLLIGGVVLAMWKLGVLAAIGTFWTAIALLALAGLGIIFAVMSSGAKRTVEIDHV